MKKRKRTVKFYVEINGDCGIEEDLLWKFASEKAASISEDAACIDLFIRKVEWGCRVLSEDGVILHSEAFERNLCVSEFKDIEVKGNGK